MKELVSILIPAYNAEKWIKYSIQSAIAQDWPKKEIIIIDDGSTDNTLFIARSFQSNYVKVITQNNRGASSARNKALSFAQGDYIQWLDADDILAPDKISNQMLIADPGNMSLHLLSSAYGIFHYRIGNAKFSPTELWRDLSPVDWVMEHFSDSKAYMALHSWLMSRKLIENAGAWDERLSLNDDGEFVCRVVLSSEWIQFVDTAKCYYRSTSFTQLSRDTSERGIQSLLLSLKLCIQHLLSFEDSERTRKASVDLLQIYSRFFYTEQIEFLEEINSIALEMGWGVLSPSRIHWKKTLFEELCRRKLIKMAMNKLRKVRFDGVVMWDEILSRE